MSKVFSRESRVLIYGDKNRHAIETAQIGSPNAIVFVGGMYCGMYSVPYLAHLDACLPQEGACLIQFLMKSSFTSFGVCSLQDDVKDISALLNDLVNKYEKKQILLLGHSTGCQDIVSYLSSENGYMSESTQVKDSIKCAVLQAPVSDRQYLFHAFPERSAKLLEWARQQKFSPDVIYSELIDGVAMSAYRLGSLLEKNGDDDFFSTDQSVEELKTQARKLHVPVVCMFSGQDQYFVVQDNLLSLIKSMREAWPDIKQCYILSNMNHSCDSGDNVCNPCASALVQVLRQWFNLPAITKRLETPDAEVQFWPLYKDEK